jgi:hypothetical protein
MSALFCLHLPAQSDELFSSAIPACVYPVTFTKKWLSFHASGIEVLTADLSRSILGIRLQAISKTSKW